MWDDFWNWLPSAAYAYGHDSLVWPDLPPSFSIFPGYPQGVPLMIAAASFIAGRFLEAAGLYDQRLREELFYLARRNRRNGAGHVLVVDAR